MDPDTHMTECNTGSVSQEAAPAPQLTSDPLETASQRLLLYLKGLRIPVHQRYDLVEEALNRASALHISDGDIVSASMRCLREILASDPRFKDTTDLQTFFFNHDNNFLSMPPMNRSSMIPVPLERTGPLKFFFLMFIRMVLAPFRPPLRTITLLVLLAAAVALYFWQRGAW